MIYGSIGMGLFGYWLLRTCAANEWPCHLAPASHAPHGRQVAKLIIFYLEIICQNLPMIKDQWRQGVLI